MPNIDNHLLEDFILKQIINPFYEKRLSALEKFSLKKILKSKNPYLFKAKNIETAQDFIKSILDALISSSEETIFGNLLEELAIYTNQKVYNGKKSSAKGIDLEFEKDSIYYLVSIKSGPNWGNSSQVAKMVSDFNSAKRTLRTSNSNNLNIEFVNGCCYGRDNNPDKTNYLKLCGQKFWELISGENEFYLKIIEPLDKKAKEKDDNSTLNLLTQEFLESFCDNGRIDWQKIVQYNSGV
jgi:hypothetical protein